MKKLFFLLSTIFITAASFGQFEYSVKAGGNAAYLTKSGYEIKYGLAAGGQVYYRLNKTVSFGTELIYSNQGIKNEGMGWFYDESANENVRRDYYKAYHLHYLNIPFMSKFNIYKGFYGAVGPQLSFLMKGTYVLDVQDLDAVDKTEDIKNYKDLKSSDFGVVFDMGYEHKSGVFMDVRYNFGFIKVYEGEENGYHNSALQATVGYKFGKPKETAEKK